MTNADESLSFSESVTPSDYVPLSAENTASHDVTPDPEPELNVEPIVEKPPQLKVFNIFEELTNYVSSIFSLSFIL